MSNTIDSSLNLTLPDIDVIEDELLHDILEDVHDALELLLTAIGYNIATITAAYTMVETDGTILIDASSSAVTATLPSAANLKGKRFTIKCTDATNTATLDGDGSETIDGAASITLALNVFVTVQSDGTNWAVVG